MLKQANCMLHRHVTISVTISRPVPALPNRHTSRSPTTLPAINGFNPQEQLQYTEHKSTESQAITLISVHFSKRVHRAPNGRLKAIFVRNLTVEIEISRQALVLSVAKRVSDSSFLNRIA